MVMPEAVPISVLTDKERLADYILARAPVAQGPEPVRPRWSRRLRVPLPDTFRPRAWMLSAGVHAGLILILAFLGYRNFPVRIRPSV